MSDAKLLPSHRHILCVLKSHAGDDMTVKQLAEATGYCERQLKRLLPVMAENEWVAVDHRPGKATRYRVRVSQDDKLSCDTMSHHDILSHDNVSEPRDARVHEAREESLFLTHTLGELPEKKKEKDSVAKKPRRASSSNSSTPKPKPTIPDIPDDLRPRFELIGKLTDTSLNSPVIWQYHHFFSGTVSANRKNTDWYLYQIVGGLSDEALRDFIAYEKRQFIADNRPGTFCLRKLDTLNNKVNKWLDKRAVQQADRQQRELIQRQSYAMTAQAAS